MYHLIYAFIILHLFCLSVLHILLETIGGMCIYYFEYLETDQLHISIILNGTNHEFVFPLLGYFFNIWTPILGEFTPSYILHTRAFRTYLLGGGYLPCKKDYKVIVFYMQTCFIILKSLILHVHFFPKFTYNEYIGPYFLSHVV
jgi:hypothetical protein